MEQPERIRVTFVAALVIGARLITASSLVQAQPASGDAAGPVPPPNEVASPPAAEPRAPPAAPTAVALPPVVTGPPPAPSPDPKAFIAGAWMRLGGRLQNPSNPNELNDVWLSDLYLIAAFRGNVTDWLKWQINLNANVPPPTTNMMNPSISGPPATYASVGIQDLIVKIEPHDLFNVWVGRMIVPMDRATLSGPWFINYWTSPGFFGNRPGAPVGTKASQNGRDPGVTVWGQVGKGMFKYYVGAFNLDGREQTVTPLYTARLTLDLLDPEPGYYNQSSYHGEKDIIALGAGMQFQKNAAFSAANGLGNLTTFEGELLVDKKLGPAGVATLEASGYFFDKRQPIRRFIVLGVGYVTPQEIGVGRLCPAVRYQFTQETELRQFDFYLSYLVKSHFAKFFAGFFLADYPDPMNAGGKLKSKAVQLGVQIIKF